MRTTPALIALALAAALTACGEDDGTVTVSPPPATVTVTEEPILTDLPPPEPEPRLLTLAEICEAWSDLRAPTDFDPTRVLDHVERVDALLEVAEPSVSQTFEPLRRDCCTIR